MASLYDPEWHRTRRWIGLAIVAILGIFVVGMLVLAFTYGPTMMQNGAYPYFPFGFGWIWILVLFFLFFGMLRWAFFPWHGGYYRRYGYYGRENEAYHILQARYARGEITKDQYDQMMRDLYPPPRQGP